MKVAIYARVSQEDLNLENQLGPLRRRALTEGWEVQEFTEKESSRNTRPVKEEVLKLLRNKELGGVCVFALDRWSRSVAEFAQELLEFEKRGIRFYSMREGFSFDNAMGRAMIQMAAVFAQLERDLIKERTLAGLARAGSQGKIGGRHPVGCGCGIVTKEGERHEGPVKPIRDEHNRVVGWQKQTSPVSPGVFSEVDTH